MKQLKNLSKEDILKEINNLSIATQNGNSKITTTEFNHIIIATLKKMFLVNNMETDNNEIEKAEHILISCFGSSNIRED